MKGTHNHLLFVVALQIISGFDAFMPDMFYASASAIASFAASGDSPLAAYASMCGAMSAGEDERSFVERVVALNDEIDRSREQDGGAGLGLAAVATADPGGSTPPTQSNGSHGSSRALQAME